MTNSHDHNSVGFSFSEEMKTVLVIAGSDPSGGAGVQGDIKTCMANHTFAMGVITALTVQNTTGVKSFRGIDSAYIKEQIEFVVEDIKPDAVKIGMLPSPEAVKAVGEVLRIYDLRNVVVDPVLISSSGKHLNTDIKETATAMEEYLFANVTMVTPNLSEASFFIYKDLYPNEINNEEMADLLSRWDCKAILIKGGHSGEAESTDLLFTRDACVRSFSHERIITQNDHGTGCALSSAIASGLAHGMSIELAVENAKRFVSHALIGNSGRKIGNGHGPLNFFNTHI